MNTKSYFINYSINNNSKNDLNSFYEIDKENITPINLKEITISENLLGGNSENSSSDVDTTTTSAVDTTTTTTTELSGNTSTDNTDTSTNTNTSTESNN